MQRKWKRHWQRLAKAMRPLVAAGLLVLSAYSPALANPTGGTVTSGSATIASSGSTMTINQTTNNAIINWQNFSIGKGEKVKFVQPGSSSVALNRVIGNDASSIYGSLNANGKVFLINPNGILFSRSAQVNVGGLVASTLNITDSDFLSGKYSFSKDGDAGSVINQGSITATNEAVLIGPKVANEGVIAAKATGLAAGNKVSLDFNGDNLLKVAVDTGAAGGSAVNSGTITSTGGLVVMSAGTADTLLGTVVNNSGVIRAQNVNNVNGVIRLEGGSVTNSGTLDASGKASGQTGGTVKVLGDTVTLASGSTIDVSGDAGGGTALVGGATKGASSEYAATTTTIASGATINADATNTGNGGEVVVWANDTTKFAGTVTARGGEISGDGGSVETSGAHVKISDSASVTTLSAYGKSGTWLIDPDGFTIAASGGDMTGTAVSSALNGGNFEIQSTGGSGSDGDINVNDAVSWNKNKLTLTATNDVNINAVMTATGTASLALKPGSGTVNCALSSSGFTGKVNFSGTGSLSIGTDTYAVITSRSALQSMSSTGHYVLGSDIDISGANFTPVSSFSGVFDGLGNTITGLTVNSTNSGGMFSTLTGTVRNLGLVNVDINCVGMNVGALAAFNNSGSILNCYSSGQVTNTYSSGNATGGLVGRNYGSSSITNSYSTCDVSLNNISNENQNAVGGLVGLNYGTIEYCYTTGGQVSANGKVLNYVGGLVGLNDNGSINYCYSIDSVTAEPSGDYLYVILGGLVGYNYNGGSGSGGTITNSYSMGAVNSTATGDYVYIGGLVGQNYGSSISTCYSTGKVSGSRVAGLVGMNIDGAITNCYWDSETSTTTKGVWEGGSATGLSDSNMKLQASYTPSGTSAGQWDFTNVWAVDSAHNNGYPYLQAVPTTLTTITLSGTLLGYGAGYTIVAVDNGTVLDSTETITGGNYSFSLPLSSVGSGTSLLCYVSGESVQASLVYISGGTSASNLNLTGTTVTVDGNARNLSNTNLTTAIGSLTSSDILYSTSGNNITFSADALIKNANSVTINGALNAGIHNITISSINPVIQTSSGVITAAGLVLLGSGSYTLNIAENVVGTLAGGSSGAIGTLKFKNDSDFAIGNSTSGLTSSGVVTLTSSGTVTQTKPISATGLELLGTGNYTLTNTGNLIGTIAAGTSTTSVSRLLLTNAQALTVGTGGIYSLGDVTLATTGGNSITLAGNVTTATGTQTYNSAVTINNSGTTTLSSSGGNIIFADTLDGTTGSSAVVVEATAGAITLGATGTTNLLDSLTISAGGTITAPYTVNVGTFILNGGTWRQIGSSLPTFSATDFRISDGTFIRAINSNTTAIGTSANPYLITDVYGLQGIGSSGMLGNYYTLVNSIDASDTSGWNSGAGFVPIGNSSTNFTGTFSGNSYTISNLFINSAASYVGLVGVSSGTIQNLGLIGGSVTGTNSTSSVTGGLVGWNNNGMITNCYDNIAVSLNNVSGLGVVGGLVGASSGTISDSYSTSDVGNIGTVNLGAIGGLVGANGGIISHSYSTGTVTGNIGTAGVGGVGGLVGANGGTILESYSTDTVTGSGGSEAIGGLVGVNGGNTTSTSISSYISGLIANSYSGSITDCYSTGQVTGNGGGNLIGGLVGLNDGTGGNSTITNCYSISKVTGSGSSNIIGGFVGSNDGTSSTAVITNSYWDVDTSHTTVGIGTGTVTSGATGLTSLGTEGYASAFEKDSYSGWNIATSGGSSSIWRMYEGQTYPLLRYFLTSLTVAAGNVTTTYNGAAYSGSPSGVTYTTTSGTTSSAPSNVFGTLSYGSNPDAGTYSLTGQYSNQQGYDISYSATSTLKINPEQLTVSTSPVTKTYDGTTSASGSAVLTSGTLYNGDTLSGGTFAFTDPNAGIGNKTVTVSGVTTTNSANSGNYTISYADNTSSTINPETLTVTTSSVTKTYDGTTSASGSAVLTSGTLYNGDTLSGGTFAFTDPNAGIGNKTVTVSGVTTTNSANGGNYTISYADNTSSTINPETLTVSTSSVTKTYDGTTSASGSVVLTSGTLYNGDTLSGGTFAYTDSNAGIGNKRVTVSGVAITNSADSGNYTISYADNTSSTINPEMLTVTTSSVTKTYDGTTSASGSVVLTSGTLYNGDTLSGGTFAFIDPNAGIGNKTVTVSGVTTTNSANSGNYTINYDSNTTSTINPETLTVSTSSVTKTYDGTTSASGSAVLTSGTLYNGDTLSGGTFAYTDSNAGIGNKKVTVSGVAITDSANSGNYTISYADNTSSTINPEMLTVTTSSVTKTYDGTTSASGSVVLTSGTLYNGDTLSGGTFAFTDPNAGSGNKKVTVSGVTTTNSANYTINYDSNTTSTINPETLTVSTSSVTKTYDGTTSASGSVVLTSGTLYNSDTLSGGTFAYTDPNAGSGNKKVTVSGVAITDSADSGNYTISYADNTSSTINPETLTVSTSSVTKTYDGTTSASGSVVLTSGTLYNGDTLSGGTFAYTDSNAGIGNKKVTVSGVAITDSANSGNYTISYADNTSSTINLALLTITANSVIKEYDGLPYSGGNGVTYGGFVNGESSAVLSGTLIFGGNSQGAVDSGSYSIEPGGLSSTNYDIDFVNGILNVRRESSQNDAYTGATGNILRNWILPNQNTIGTAGGTFNLAIIPPGINLTGYTFATDFNNFSEATVQVPSDSTQQD
nr:heme/hemopexin-binding protein precursor [Sporomusa silvacetica DSM 10669]